jgi:hypothetical protein
LLNGRKVLQADAEVSSDGCVHVVICRSSNFTGVEIYSLQTSREPTPWATEPAMEVAPAPRPAEPAVGSCPRPQLASKKTTVLTLSG